MADGVLQYIGARYVPTFYLNSAGTPEWRPGVAFEPLTIVTWNNNSYTSRKPVPAEIGEPSLNPEYWAQTGVYNAQIGQLQNDVGELQTSVANLEKEAFWYTPEMFGAVGDGITDDHDAFQDMLDTVPANSAILCMASQYRIGSPLTITSEKSNLKISGGFERSEYNPEIHADFESGVLFTVYAYGCQFSNILFSSNGNAVTPSGVTLFSLNGEQNSGNIDAIFNNVAFFKCYRAMLIVGRNVRVFNSIFSMLYVGAWIEPMPGVVVEMRGYVFQANRVHSIGTLVYSTVAMQNINRGLIIKDNYADFSQTLLNGFRGGNYISGNVITRYGQSGVLVVLNDNDNASDELYDVFQDNIIVGSAANNVQDAGVRVVDGRLIAVNNIFQNLGGSGIICGTTSKAIIRNNVFNNVSAVGGYPVECAATASGIVKYNTLLNCDHSIVASGMTVADNDTITL